MQSSIILAAVFSPSSPGSHRVLAGHQQTVVVEVTTAGLEGTITPLLELLIFNRHTKNIDFFTKWTFIPNLLKSLPKILKFLPKIT